MIPFIMSLSAGSQAVAEPEEETGIYFVSETGTGDGLSESTPMNLADLLALTLIEDDQVKFNKGDEF